MSAIFLLIGCSLLIAGAFLMAFIWSMTSGQYEDDYTPSVRILLEDEQVKNTNSNQTVKLETNAN